LLCIFAEGIGDAHMRQEHLLRRAVRASIHDFQILSDYSARNKGHLHSLWRMVSPRRESTKS